MVLASNEWLTNSGDDQKQTPGLTSSAPTSNVETAIAAASAATTPISKIFTNERDQQNINSMNAAKTSSEMAGGGVVGVGGGTTTDEKEKEIVKATDKSIKLNDNANSESEMGFGEKQQQEQQQEQQIDLDKVLKEMATLNSTTATATTATINTTTNTSNSEYTTSNDGGGVVCLETSRTVIENAKEEQTPIDELENNNRTYASFIDEIIVSGTGGGGIDTDYNTTDSNTNTLNAADLTARISSATNELLCSQQPMCKTDDPAFLNLLSNANTVQRIASNFANSLSSGRLHVFGIDSSATAAAAAAAQQRATSSLLNNSGGSSGNNSARNKGSSSSLNSANDLAVNATNSNDSVGEAKIVLICQKTSHPFETRTISLTPNIECKVGRLIAKCKPSESNAIFDCKVLSRNHAVLWYGSDGKFWVKDTNSSNGTFINDKKLNKDAAELNYGDIVKFGVDVLENSRKEVHGCIIACVKLYLPDGREAISIESSSPRSQFSGDSRISFDELHRLNVYMQETSQREKALKAKLYNIQNLLDATRKNSSTCWSAMISEDQLLHRIHSLEKKLQILEKNMPESALKNEIMKLIDDKSAYQHSAKEALRSVYAERCEAMQKLAKLESELAASENESKILREQMTTTEVSFQDVNERLRQLESEYKEYQTETANQHLEAKMNLEQRIEELNQKLQEREEDCETLRTKISALIAKRTRQHSAAESQGGDEEKLQKQAMENLDAVIANMDIGDDDDDDDDDDYEEDAVDEDVAAAVREKQKQKRLKSGDVYDFNNSSDSSGNEKQTKSKTAATCLKANSSASQVVGGEATILKWLRNSDLNKKEGSLDIFKAICNESDSSDEHDAISPGAAGAGTAENFKQRCTKISTKLQSLKKTLNQLENEINLQEEELEAAFVKQQQPKPKINKIEEDDAEYNDVNVEEEEEADIENIAVDKTNGQFGAQKQQSISMLKTTMQLFSEVYEEINENFKQFKAATLADLKAKNANNSNIIDLTKTKFQKVKGSGLNATTTLSEIDEVDSEDEDDAVDVEEDDGQSVTKSDISTIVMKSTEQQTTAAATEQREIENYQSRIEDLQRKLNEQQHNAEHTLELMQIECDSYKEKIAQLTLLNDRLRATEKEAERGVTTAAAVAIVFEQQQQQQHANIAAAAERAIVDDLNNGDAVSSDSGISSIDRNIETATNLQGSFASTASTSTTSMSMSSSSAAVAANAANTAFELQMREELAAINSTVAQREEELIAYKESLERTEKENLKLREEIQKQQQGDNNGYYAYGGSNISKATLMRFIVPMGIAAFGMLAYLLITYL